MGCKKFVEDFKKFALKGNVIDLAVAVVIGTAFGKIVSSLVADIITPLIGIVLGGVDFTNLKYTIGASSITYGNFLQSIFDFIIIAFAIFIFVTVLSKAGEKIRKKEVAENIAVTTKKGDDILLLEEIRDLLKK
ncbi:MAG: large conductance mechanosensitive channel protein MscL [Candidatus Gracilibacteria bacterium]|nr:large conductance mechanosensitive channel protein MscL [Candidatus Gracilibacteria bacterium]